MRTNQNICRLLLYVQLLAIAAGVYGAAEIWTHRDCEIISERLKTAYAPPLKTATLKFERALIEDVCILISIQTDVVVIPLGKAKNQPLDLNVENALIVEALDQIIAGKDWW